MNEQGHTNPAAAIQEDGYVRPMLVAMEVNQLVQAGPGPVYDPTPCSCYQSS